MVRHAAHHDPIADIVTDAQHSLGQIQNKGEVPMTNEGKGFVRGFEPGLIDDDVYKRRMRPWVFRGRSAAIAHLRKREMSILLRIQTLRTNSLNTYFVGSALLGTHTFFMFFLPIFFWFGYPDLGNKFLYNLAYGVYFSSWAKDLFCIPRPFAPPLVRLSLSTHADEYGFPSTHSTNAVGMAILLAFEVRKLVFSTRLIQIVYATALLFGASVTFGRAYAGMHSFLDVGFGSLMGVSIYYAHEWSEASLNALILGNPLIVTALSTATVFFLSFVRPYPVEPCPCWEDAIAFISVLLGAIIGRTWFRISLEMATYGFGDPTLQGRALHALCIVIKLILGVSNILVWRAVAKPLCKVTLPPIVALFVTRPKALTPDPETRVIEDVFESNVGYLSKIVVYTGIGFVAGTGTTLLFTYLGLSVPLAYQQ